MKSYQINLDALIVIAVLLAISIGANIFLISKYNAVADENVKQKLQIMTDGLNLNSSDAYIKKLELQCGIDHTTEAKN